AAGAVTASGGSHPAPGVGRPTAAPSESSRAAAASAAKPAARKPAKKNKRSGDDDIDLTALFAE
ncbi:MAG: hypothetical protein ACKON9_06170, partial [Planctomycetaceae bacterium]